jgi:hypothetical protein
MMASKQAPNTARPRAYWCCQVKKFWGTGIRKDNYWEPTFPVV